MQHAAHSDIGRVRSNNEDVWCIDPTLPLFVICDGMGGHDDGEVAAAMAAEAFRDHLRQRPVRRVLDAFVASPTREHRDRVRKALREAGLAANRRVHDESQAHVPPTTMGCTLDAALLLGDQVFLAHAGDSRIYLARGPITSQVTQDHSLYPSLLARGTISPSTPCPFPDPLTNAIGLSDDATIDVLSVGVLRGDRILLCTDGVHGAFSSTLELGRLLRQGAVEETAKGLIDAANDAGGRDNATAIVIEIAERFVNRPAGEESQRQTDLTALRSSALLSRLPEALPQRIAATGIEIELAQGETLPRVCCSALACYVLLEGQVRMPDGRTFGPPALLYPESLAGGMRDGGLAVVERPSRALRWRSDDFRDYCATDTNIAALLYERLARLLAR
ncbi:MAG: protein phosphatase 2C domain-containing protein [Polyangiaceae bacterium]|nr:protein phosphatase 2C domain-containing protein [Polyangiaceae bacterium]